MGSQEKKILGMKKLILGGTLVGVFVLVSSITLIADHQKKNMVEKSVLITDENRNQIGKESFSDYYIVNHNGKFIDSLGNEISQEELLQKKTEGIPKNRIIKQIKFENFNPSSITEFEGQENNEVTILPEIFTINGSVNILTKTNGEGWDLKEGDKLEYDFEKYQSEVVENQNLIIGYIKDGVLIKGEEFRQLKGEYELPIKESGKYYVYLISASSDPISLKNGTIKILKS